MKNILYLFLLNISFQAFSQNPQMVKDINTITTGIPNVGKQVVVGSLLYFVKEPSEIWKTDGTATGTVLVKHIISADGNAAIDNLTNVEGTIFFSATDGVLGQELWKSNGTAAGTVIVKDIYVGSSSSNPIEFEAHSGHLFFSAKTMDKGNELWKSDGTANGTVIVKDIEAGSGSSSPLGFKSVQGVLYFSAFTSTTGQELWKTDGTIDGTVLVKDINPGTSNSNPEKLTNVSGYTLNNGVLFFAANDGTHGEELWKSDGTTAGTVMIEDIYAGANGSYPNYMSNVNGILYFSADDATNGRELWKSIGNDANTTMIKDIFVGTNSGLTTPNDLNYNKSFWVIDTTFYFMGNDGTNDFELWKSDGTSAGTVMVKDINTAGNSYPYNLYNIGMDLYFAADDGINAVGLWKSNVSNGVTSLIKNISVNPNYMANLAGKLIFGARENINETSAEFWISDGTTLGTNKILSSINTLAASPNNILTIGNTIYFTANDGIHGEELWKSDGTEAGTLLVKDINVGSISSSPRSLTNLNGILLFSAQTITNGRELWLSDGSSGGTRILKDIKTGIDGSGLDNFTVVGNSVFFSASESISGNELWKTDGTPNGTEMVKDLNPGTLSSSPFYLKNVNGLLFFFVVIGAPPSHTFLYKSNGTARGTIELSDLGEFVNISSVESMGSNLYYSYQNSAHNWWYLLKNNGTSSLALKTDGLYFRSLTPVNNTVFFSATTGNGDELWKTDGSVANTVLVEDINVSGNSSPRSLSNINGTLYFSADDGNNGRGLWKSNGTSATTSLVKDIYGGNNDPDISVSYTHNDIAFFTVTDGVHGKELWKSDGTTDKTVLVADINPDNNDGFSQFTPEFCSIGDNLFFIANNGLYGLELWKYTTCPQGFSLNPTGTVISNQIASENIITLDGSTNTIPTNTNITYQAGKYIQLNSGFQTQNNAVFKAQIGGCN